MVGFSYRKVATNRGSRRAIRQEAILGWLRRNVAIVVSDWEPSRGGYDKGKQAPCRKTETISHREVATLIGVAADLGAIRSELSKSYREVAMVKTNSRPSPHGKATARWL